MAPATATVELPPLISSNMIVQNGEPLNFWGWADAGEKISIKQGGIVLATAEGQGKDTPWRVQLPAQKPGPVVDIEVIGSNTITLTHILAGEVWLCSGQSNMVMTLKKGPWCGYGGVLDADKETAAANDDQIRLFRDDNGGSAQPQLHTKGSWVVCSPDTTAQFSATAYFFGRALRRELKMPVGLVVSAVGGTADERWTPARTLEGDMEFEALKAKAQALKNQWGTQYAEDLKILAKWKIEMAAAQTAGTPPPSKPVLNLTEQQRFALADSEPILSAGGLYNGKIHPLAPYNIRGAIWYQGESNARRGESYAGIMIHLIQGWREDWNKPFPFVMVALAGYGKPETASLNPGSFPLIREAQIRVAELLPHTGVVSAVDLGDVGNINPLNKQAVGQRAALWALEHVYKRPLVSAGPGFGTVTFYNGRAVVNFKDHAEGLTLKGPGGFELAESDRKFVPAKAELKNGTLEVSAPGIEHPTALRYAFLNFPECTIYNGAGLPALPFRTDKW